MAGFDFVELHMAHFTTLASFLSLVNRENILMEVISKEGQTAHRSGGCHPQDSG